MSENPHPGAHPDPDSLSAFLEGALPEHEREACLMHFAECAACREIVFLAQEPTPVAPAPRPISAARRWFVPAALFGGAAACALIVTLSMHPRQKPQAQTVEVAANAPAPSPPQIEMKSEPAVRAKLAPRVAPPPAAHIASSAQVAAPQTLPSRTVLPLNGRDVVALGPGRFLPLQPQPDNARNLSPATPPPVANPEALMIRGENSAPLVAGPLRLSIQHDGAPSSGGLAEIAGAVTDPTGSGIPGATVTLIQSSGASRKVQADRNGKFELPTLPAGRYDLRIESRGFQTASGQIELQAQDLATVTPILSLGTTTETVQVTAAAQVVPATPSPTSLRAMPLASRAAKRNILPDANDLAKPTYQLPGDRKAVSTAASGKLILALDSDGALFSTRNAGKTWKMVKSVWQGKAVSLARLPESPAVHDVFQLTTDAGSVWLSQDGARWRQAPPPR